MSASAARFAMPSFWQDLWRWIFTLPTEMLAGRAISLSHSPAATNLAISSSRGVSS